MNYGGRGPSWHWACDEFVMYAASRGKSAAWIAATMPGRSAEAITTRARLTLHVKLAPSPKLGVGSGRPFQKGNPGYGFRRKAAA